MRTVFPMCLLLSASLSASLPVAGQDLASFAVKAKTVIEAKNPNWKPTGKEKLIGKDDKDSSMAGELEKAALPLSSSTALPHKRRPIGCNSS